MAWLLDTHALLWALFDSLLIWHAIHCKYTLLSRDRAMPFFKAHGLKSEW